MLVAWAGGPVAETTIEPLAAQGAKRLVLAFSTVDRGAVLRAADT